MKLLGDNRGKSIKHGYTGKPTYRAWQEMKYRCHTKTCKAYKSYGGRGIKVCDRWLESFENFLEDMGERPSSKHSLDRVDNDKGYSKENCRWATQKQQCNNKRDNHVVSYKGKRYTITELSDIINIPRNVLYKRVEQGVKLDKPVRAKKPKHDIENIKIMIDRHNNGMTKREAARSIGAHPKTFNALKERYNNG